MKHTGSFSIFKQNFCKKGSDVCNQRLHSILDQIMIRRAHADQLMGRPIVSLPDMQQETIYLDFNKVESTVYTIIEMRYRHIINTASKDMKQEDRTRLVLIMLQRLRQMTSHIFMYVRIC